MKTVRPYSPAIEAQMQRYYQSLSEKDRRRYAAIEAVKISAARPSQFPSHTVGRIRREVIDQGHSLLSKQ
jgi:hypothetical protein